MDGVMQGRPHPCVNGFVEAFSESHRFSSTVKRVRPSGLVTHAAKEDATLWLTRLIRTAIIHNTTRGMANPFFMSPKFRKQISAYHTFARSKVHRIVIIAVQPVIYGMLKITGISLLFFSTEYVPVCRGVTTRAIVTAGGSHRGAHHPHHHHRNQNRANDSIHRLHENPPIFQSSTFQRRQLLLTSLPILG